MARGLGTKGRFAVAYLVLGAAIGTALGGFIVLLQRPGPQPPAPWSSWKPGAASLSTRVLEIAQHVGDAYRLPSGDPLVAVKVSSKQSGPNIQGVVVVKKDDPKALDKQYAKDDTAVYILCGAGKTCAMNQGSPGIVHGTVLRREALELALFTLEYAHPIDNVLIFFPPANGQSKLSSTLFLRRDDVSGSLKHPLRKTLPQSPAPLPGRIAPNEKKTVDDLTGTKLFNYLGIAQNIIVIQPANGPTF